MGVKCMKKKCSICITLKIIISLLQLMRNRTRKTSSYSHWFTPNTKYSTVMGLLHIKHSSLYIFCKASEYDAEQEHKVHRKTGNLFNFEKLIITLKNYYIIARITLTDRPLMFSTSFLVACKGSWSATVSAVAVLTKANWSKLQVYVHSTAI